MIKLRYSKIDFPDGSNRMDGPYGQAYQKDPIEPYKDHKDHMDRHTNPIVTIFKHSNI
ncbi:MAG: hypothetical protein AB8G18_07745 [Gammaproteobacteria bacterium]